MAIEKPNKKIEKDTLKKGLIESIVVENQENEMIDPKNPKKKIKQKMFYCPPDIEAAILIRKAKTGQDISEIVCEAIKKDLKIEIEQVKHLI